MMRRCLVLLLALCLLAPMAQAEAPMEVSPETIAVTAPGEAQADVPMEVSLEAIAVTAPGEAQAVDAPAGALTDPGEVVSREAVAPASEAGVAVIPMAGNASYSVEIGKTCRIEADGAIESCKSSKNSVATVTDAGVITAIAGGKTRITVKLAGKKKKYKLQLTVTDPTIPTGIAIDQGGEVLLDKSETLQLTYALTPAAAVSDVTWKSSKKKVATISATGLVTPLKAGTTTITAKTAKGKKSAKIKVNVVDTHAPVSVSIDQGSGLSMGVGESAQLSASATALSEPAVTTFTWSSSKKKIATVSETGLVTAVKAGTAKITVKTDNKKKATITVQVGNRPPEPQTPEQPAVTGRIDLYPYLRTDMHKAAKALGLRKKEFPPDVGGYEETYENDCLYVTLNNYSSAEKPTPIEIIYLEKDPEGKYCVDGFCIGMSASEAEAQLVQKGFKLEDSLTHDGVLDKWYVKGAYAIAFSCRDQTLVHICAEFRPWNV